MPFPVRPGPWVPKFDVSFIGPLLITAKSLIERDQAEALVWASPDKVLQPFQKVLIARRDQAFWKDRLKNYPAVVLAPVQTLAPASNDGIRVQEDNRIIAEVVLYGENPHELTIDSTNYVKAVDQMWRAASQEDLRWNLKVGHHTEIVVDCTEHNYPTIASDGPNAYMYTLELILTAEFQEG